MTRTITFDFRNWASVTVTVDREDRAAVASLKKAGYRQDGRSWRRDYTALQREERREAVLAHVRNLAAKHEFRLYESGLVQAETVLQIAEITDALPWQLDKAALNAIPDEEPGGGGDDGVADHVGPPLSVGWGASEVAGARWVAMRRCRHRPSR